MHSVLGIRKSWNTSEAFSCTWAGGWGLASTCSCSCAISIHVRKKILQRGPARVDHFSCLGVPSQYGPGPHLNKIHLFQWDQQNPASLKQLRTCSLALIPVGAAGSSHSIVAEDGYVPFGLKLKKKKKPWCTFLNPQKERPLYRTLSRAPGKECVTNNKTNLPLFTQWRHLCLVSNAQTFKRVLLSGGSELYNFIPLMWIANNFASSLRITVAFRYEVRFLLPWRRGAEAQEKISSLINLSWSLVFQ